MTSKSGGSENLCAPAMPPLNPGSCRTGRLHRARLSGMDTDRSLRVLVLHSPLMGPPSLAPLAQSLAAAGHEVVLPDLTAVADEPRPAWMVDSAISAAGEESVDVVVAHSGAGAVLPLVGEAVHAGALVFLDAVLPTPGEAVHVLDADQQRLLDEHTDHDGRVGRWTTWWPRDAIELMLPDPAERDRIASSCPRVPRSFWDHEIPLPARWAPAGFIALGVAYREELERAASLGWPCRSLGRHHLAAVTDPEDVAAAVVEVAAELLADGETVERRP